MPEKNEELTARAQLVRLPQKEAPTILGCIGSERWTGEVKKVLPDYLTPEMMLRVARSVATDPRFAACSPESFLIALLKCSRAGLVPDGRNAHLIPFGKEVQAIFDWKGLVAMAKRNGVEVTAKLVYRADRFSVEEDDGNGATRVHHAVDFTRDRGEIVLVYSRAKTIKSGEIDYEFMTAEEVEHIRQTFSKAKDSLMWVKAWGEGAKKTVIRRHSKRWDLSPEDRAAISDGDDDSMPTEVIAPAPARPIFSKRTVLPAGPTPEENEEAAEAAAGLAPEQKAADTEPEPARQTEPTPEPAGQPNYLRALRGLCRMAKVKEADLLKLLVQTGTTDGSQPSLDEMNPDIIRHVHDNWADYCEKLP